MFTMETVLMAHPENEMPFCVKRVRVWNDREELVAEILDNHQSQRRIDFGVVLSTRSLRIEVEHPSEMVPAALLARAPSPYR